jgi:L-lactate utilization protein LutB
MQKRCKQKQMVCIIKRQKGNQILYTVVYPGVIGAAVCDMLATCGETHRKEIHSSTCTECIPYLYFKILNFKISLTILLQQLFQRGAQYHENVK